MAASPRTAITPESSPQHHTAPSPVTAQTNSPAAEIERTSRSPATATGGLGTSAVGRPAPSCPERFDPQHFSSCAGVTAQVYPLPAAMVFAVIVDASTDGVA